MLFWKLNTSDIDGDGLPTAAEINDPRLKTNFKEYSTNGDPYGDGQKYFDIGIPRISPADHPLVAAYPDLKVRLSRIDITPTGEITTTSGISTQKAWSDEIQNSQTSQMTNEAGVEVGMEFGYASLSPTCVGHINYHYTYTNTQETGSSETTSASGFSQNDWSTADTTNKEKAALVSLVFNVENRGTIPAQDITPFINLKLGDQVIATIGSLTKITSLPGGATSKDIVIKNDESGGEIALSLDQLRSIECGAPLTIETFQIDAKVKKWDADKKEWELLDSDFSNYMDEINKKTATIIITLDDGTFREYKVAAEGLTLGEAFNLTAGRDQSVNGINSSKMDWLFPIEAYADINKLLPDNKSKTNDNPLQNLILKPGWIISIRPSSDDLRIGWASYNKERKTVFASVTGSKKVREVWAHVKVGNRYENLTMLSPNNNTIYSNWSNEELEIDGNCSVMATDIGNNSQKFDLAVAVQPKLSRLKDGYYIIVCPGGSYDNDTPIYELECSGEDAGYNVYGKVSNRVPQKWYLKHIGNGIYSIQNEKYPGYYLEVDDGKQSDGANVQAGKYDNGNPSQQWRFVPTKMGYYTIQALHSGKCLTFEASIIQEVDQQTPWQKWILQPVDSYPFNLSLMDGKKSLIGSYYIMPVWLNRTLEQQNHPDNYLALDPTNMKNGLSVSGKDPSFVMLYLIPRGDGYFEICSNLGLNVIKNCCIQVNTTDLSNKSNGIPLGTGEFRGLDTQLWKFKYRGNDQYEICAKYSDKCINVMPWDPQQKRLGVDLWEYQGYLNQKFYIKQGPY
jgi:hypothetical protein